MAVDLVAFRRAVQKRCTVLFMGERGGEEFECGTWGIKPMYGPVEGWTGGGVGNGFGRIVGLEAWGGYEREDAPSTRVEGDNGARTPFELFVGEALEVDVEG